jgi:hypothetical protein
VFVLVFVALQPAEGQTRNKLFLGVTVLTTPAVPVMRPKRPASFTQDGVCPAPTWHPLHPALVRMPATVENTTLEVAVTVLVNEALEIALVTVMVTLQVPALLITIDTVVRVLDPKMLHPAVPETGTLHEKLRGARPWADPVMLIVFVRFPLMIVAVALARLPWIVNPIDTAGTVKLRVFGL